jgi:hypothetical protein
LQEQWLQGQWLQEQWLQGQWLQEQLLVQLEQQVFEHLLERQLLLGHYL